MSSKSWRRGPPKSWMPRQRVCSSLRATAPLGLVRKGRQGRSKLPASRSAHLCTSNHSILAMRAISECAEAKPTSAAKKERSGGWSRSTGARSAR